MAHSVRWLITDQNVTVNYDGETHIVKRSDALADRLIKALKDGKTQEIPSLVSAAKRIETFSKGNFVVRDGRVIINDVPAPQVLSDRIVRFSDEGLPFQPLLRFAEKLQQNPSFRAVNELFQFLEKNNHPLTENGNFIAYKKVGRDFMDLYSHSISNAPGEAPRVARNQVDEDPTRTCSNGLHVANWDYAAHHYGSSDDTMIEVEVDPADVVAVPIDYNQSKMRTCGYKVLGVVTQPHDETVSLRIVNPDYQEEEPLEEEEELYHDCYECGYECPLDRDLCEECELYGEEEEEEYPYDDELEDL